MPTDSIPVGDGWNLVGALSTPIITSMIHSAPPGMITSQFFSYKGSYVASDTIEPGKGYWVKVNGNGTLILSSAGNANVSAASRIRIVASSELPPSPPDGDASLPATQVPHQFALDQNYPNPFNPSTLIHYQLPVASHVTMKIYNILGQEVRTLVNDVQNAGYLSVTFDASGLPSGMYFYRLQAIATSEATAAFSDVKKLLLIK